MPTKLTTAQQRALGYISEYARGMKEDAGRTTSEVLKMSNISLDDYEQAVGKLKHHARVALHFHPDRPDMQMKSVAEGLLESGIYKSQFETMLSNGSVSAYPGGERDVWENNLFGGAYQSVGVTNRDRPKYGALDVMLHPDGPAPRFGSCYFLLSPAVSERSTFTYLDSHQDRREKGTYEEFDIIMAALLGDAFVSDFAIGQRDITPGKLIQHLALNLDKPFSDPLNKQANRNLNHYIEAQIHGDVTLQDDVEILVADASFRGTQTGEILHQICQTYSIRLHWHMGFSLAVEDVPSDFRGPTMPSLARRIAQNNRIDAMTIGLAAVDLKRNPDAWGDRGTYADVLQELKLLWHVLVRFGAPHTP